MSLDRKNWMLYGANGYTGRLIARRAIAQGVRPILAGRNEQKIEPLAKELGCEFRSFSLASKAGIVSHLDGISAVLHCAGPFVETAEPMMAACLLAGASYLDITGEIDVIELAARQHQRAVQRGVSLMPAVGFDVVPSDCLAAQLAAALPSATDLELAFSSGGSISPGTAKTMFISMSSAGRIRKDGQIIRVPTAWKTKEIPFPSKRKQAVTVPWGDVASAYYTTQIPNVCVYVASSPKRTRSLRRWRWLLPITGLPPIQWLGRQWIQRSVSGPTESQRAQGKSEFWGCVSDGKGAVAEATLRTPEGYSLTAQTALEIVKRTAAGEVEPGFSTPGKTFGGQFIEQFDGVEFAWRVDPRGDQAPSSQHHEA